MFKGFKEFLLRGNVVGLAIAVVMGVAFSAVVSSLVADLLTPLIAAIFGKPDFSQIAFTINQSTFYIGRFINAVVSFLIVGATVYYLVVRPLESLTRRRLQFEKETPRQAEGSAEEVRLLSQIRDLLEHPRSEIPHTS